MPRRYVSTPRGRIFQRPPRAPGIRGERPLQGKRVGRSRLAIANPPRASAHVEVVRSPRKYLSPRQCPPPMRLEMRTPYRGPRMPLGQAQLLRLYLFALKVDTVSGVVSMLTHDGLMADVAGRTHLRGPCFAFTRTVARL